MLNHFIVAVDDGTPEQQNAVTAHFKNSGFGYWHFFTDVWLVTTYREAETVLTIRDAIMALPAIAGSKNLIFVHYVASDPTNWAGRGAPDAFKWLHDQWSKTGA